MFKINIIWKNIKFVIDRILSQLDIVISRGQTVRSIINTDYIGAIWCEKLQPIFEVDIDIMKDFFAYDFKQNGNHPFVKTLKQYDEKHSIKYEDTYLKKYYDQFQPSTTLEVFGLDNTSKKQYSNSKGLYEYTLPWDFNTKKNINNTRLMYSGPMDIKRGNYELNRLIKVHNSIKKMGYNPQKTSNLYNSNNIQGYFLRKENEYKFIVLHGKHRVSSLAVQGIKYIPVTFELGKPRVVNISDVDEWPQVKNKMINREEAILIFNKFFA